MFYELIQKFPLYVCVGHYVEEWTVDDRMDEQETEKELKVSILIEREKEWRTKWANEQWE